MTKFQYIDAKLRLISEQLGIELSRKCVMSNFVKSIDGCDSPARYRITIRDYTEKNDAINFQEIERDSLTKKQLALVLSWMHEVIYLSTRKEHNTHYEGNNTN